MKIFFHIVLVTFISVATQAQSLLKSSSEINHAIADTAIKKIKPQKFGRTLKVKYKDGSQQRIKMDSLWGYKDKKGRIFRLYKNVPYQILKENEFVTYFINSNTTMGPRTYRFYSKTRDSEIVMRKRKLDNI